MMMQKVRSSDDFAQLGTLPSPFTDSYQLLIAYQGKRGLYSFGHNGNGQV